MNENNKAPVSVVIVNYKTPELTKKALQALFASSVTPAQVILVDNKSDDGLFDVVRSEFPTVHCIANDTNVGFAKANNLAIRTIANQPYVWLLNSDTETGKNSLEQLVSYMEKHKEVGALSPQLVYPTREWQSVGGYFPSISNVFFYLIPLTYFLPKKFRYKLKSIALFPQPIQKDGVELDYATGAAGLLRTEALKEVGLLGEEYFMYFEETDLCWRMKHAGWKVVAIDTDPVMHVYGGSFKTKYDVRRLKLFQESLKIFIKKNYSGSKKIVMLAEIFLFGSLSLMLKRIKALV